MVYFVHKTAPIEIQNLLLRAYEKSTRDFDFSRTLFNPPHTFPLELGFPGVDPVPGPAAGPLVEPRVHVGVGARLPPGRGVQSRAQRARARDALVAHDAVVTPPREIL